VSARCGLLRGAAAAEQRTARLQALRQTYERELMLLFLIEALRLQPR
jgi:hypothetical protein